MPTIMVEADLQARLEMHVGELHLSQRAENFLVSASINTVEDLLSKTRDDLLAIDNFGEKCLEEVYLKLEEIGFYRPSRQPA